MSTQPIATPAADTPERRAFYERISHQTPDAAVAVAGQPRHARAGQRVPAGGVGVRRHSRRDDRSRRPDHREGSRAPRADPREPRPARAVEDHHRPLRRRPARAARRGRPGAPPRPERAALRARRRRRPHRGQRRAHARCTKATSSSRRRWPGTTTATTAETPIFWLDGLDIPIVQFLDASFAEHHDQDEQPISRPDGDSEARFGSNLLPIDYRAPAPPRSSIIPYAAIAGSARAHAADRQLGRRATG